MAEFLDFLVFWPNLNKSVLLFFLLIVKSALNILLKKFVGKKLLKLRKNEDKIYELLIYYSFALDFQDCFKNIFYFHPKSKFKKIWPFFSTYTTIICNLFDFVKSKLDGVVHCIFLSNLLSLTLFLYVCLMTAWQSIYFKAALIVISILQMKCIINPAAGKFKVKRNSFKLVPTTRDKIRWVCPFPTMIRSVLVITYRSILIWK